MRNRKGMEEAYVDTKEGAGCNGRVEAHKKLIDRKSTDNRSMTQMDPSRHDGVCTSPIVRRYGRT